MTTAAKIFLLLTLFSCYSCKKYTYQYYPWYHFGPLISSETKVGWMNDPNGLCIFNDEYHFFYQYNPYNSTSPGTVHWGHAKSRDLVNWVQLPIALYPDKPYDKNGVFSGSAIVDDGVMYIYYTGNVDHPGQNPDHEQHQILVTSDDGKTFKKHDKNPIIVGAKRQPNFRDPKVWKHEDTFYMVLGNSYNNNTLGRVLLYTSKDKITWTEVSVLDKSDGFLGYMWECPDFFAIGKYFVLMFSPQGVPSQDDYFKNLYTSGYIVGIFDYRTNMFTQTHQFRELDHGHDFYATQTVVNRQGQRVLVAWMDMWEQNYPEGLDGFTGQLTIPRVLELTRDGRLMQKPLKALVNATGKKLYSGSARSGTKVKLEYNAAKVEIRASGTNDFELVMETESGNDTVTFSYDFTDGKVTLDRGGHDGVRRTKYRPVERDLHIVLFIDASSLEVFIENGLVTMSSRIFPSGPMTVTVGENSCAKMMSVHSMRRTIASPNQYV